MNINAVHNILRISSRSWSGKKGVFQVSKSQVKNGWNNAKTNKVHLSNSSKCSKSYNMIGILAVHGKSLRCKRGIMLALFPFGFLQNRKDQEALHNRGEILAKIPQEVFNIEELKKPMISRTWLQNLVYALWDNFGFVLRMTRILMTFTPVLCLYPLTYINDSFKTQWWKVLLLACEFSGPTFIKLGQWAGTRRDLFSEEFCDMFSVLHHSTRQHSWYFTKRNLEKAFGKNWRKIFVKVEKVPVGSGCIAQVHRAYMKASMIPDQTIVEDVMIDEHQDDDNEIDFAEGLEIIGVNNWRADKQDDIDDEEFENKKNAGQVTVVPNTKIPQLLRRTTEEMEEYKSKLQKSLLVQPSDAKVEEEPNSVEPLTSSNVDEDSAAFRANLLSEQEEELVVPVAVKVLHPGVYVAFKRDLSILMALAKMLEFCIPNLRWLSLRDSVQEFEDLMMKQIDLRYEARALERFEKNFADVPNVRFPKPIRPYCKRRVLVETFEEAEPISNYINEQEDKEHPDGLKEFLALVGVDAMLQMVFTDNFVHGDLHPGNILVQNADEFTNQDENKVVLVDICDTLVVNVATSENPVRLVLLDAGIYTSLQEKDLQNFRNVFRAVVIGEGETVAEMMLKHSSYNECKDVESFKKELGEIVMTARKATIKLGKLQVGKLLSDVFAVLSRHKVKMESNFASVILAIFVLEGLGRSLDPELDILSQAKPILHS